MAAEAPSTPYLSVAQVARRLDCSVSLVQKWRRLGWLPATRLGPPEVPVYGYLPEDVDRFARERWNRRRGRPPQAHAATAPGRALQPESTRAPAHAPALFRSSPAAVPSPAPLPTPPTPSSPPSISQPALRPLVLWDADPRAGTAIVLARFRPDELDYALRVATAWAHRYDTLALGEAAALGMPATVLELWQGGRHVRPDSA